MQARQCLHAEAGVDVVVVLVDGAVDGNGFAGAVVAEVDVVGWGQARR